MSKQSSDLIRLLHSRWSSLTFSEAALAVAVDWQHSDIIKFVLERCECVRVTEEILSAADIRTEVEVVDLLLLHDPDIHVPELMVIRAMGHICSAIKFLDALHRHGKPLQCTENVVAAAADSSQGPAALQIVL